RAKREGEGATLVRKGEGAVVRRLRSCCVATRLEQRPAQAVQLGLVEAAEGRLAEREPFADQGLDLVELTGGDQRVDEERRVVLVSDAVADHPGELEALADEGDALGGSAAERDGRPAHAHGDDRPEAEPLLAGDGRETVGAS